MRDFLIKQIEPVNTATKMESLSSAKYASENIQEQEDPIKLTTTTTTTTIPAELGSLPSEIGDNVSMFEDNKEFNDLVESKYLPGFDDSIFDDEEFYDARSESYEDVFKARMMPIYANLDTLEKQLKSAIQQAEDEFPCLVVAQECTTTSTSENKDNSGAIEELQKKLDRAKYEIELFKKVRFNLESRLKEFEARAKISEQRQYTTRRLQKKLNLQSLKVQDLMRENEKLSAANAHLITADNNRQTMLENFLHTNAQNLSLLERCVKEPTNNDVFGLKYIIRSERANLEFQAIAVGQKMKIESLTRELDALKANSVITGELESTTSTTTEATLQEQLAQTQQNIAHVVEKLKLYEQILKANPPAITPLFQLSATSTTVVQNNSVTTSTMAPSLPNNKCGF